MLVPQAWVNEWYRKDHPIRKSFNYLYQNPLWEKDTPIGFSVCPYFWMSVLVSPLFRVCVVWPCLLMGSILKFIKIDALDRWLSNTFFRKISPPPGGGAALSLFIILLTCVLSGFAFVVSNSIMIYLSAVAKGGVNIYPFVFLISGIITGIITFIVVAIYNKKNKYKENRCRAEVYIYLWAFVFIVLSLIFCYNEVVFCLEFVGCAVAMFVKAVMLMLMFVIGKIWVVIKWCGGFLKVVFCAVLIWIPLVCMMAIFVGIGWLCIMTDKYFPQKNKQEVEKNSEEIEKIKIADYSERICSELSYILAIELMDNLKDLIPEADYHFMAFKVKPIFSTLFNKKDHSDICRQIYMEVQSNGNLDKIIHRVVSELHENAKELMIESIELAVIKKKKKEEWDALCLKCTNLINNIIVIPLCRFWDFICYLFKVLVVKPFKFGMVLLSLFCTVLWAKKKKACPYIRFQD